MKSVPWIFAIVLVLLGGLALLLIPHRPPTEEAGAGQPPAAGPAGAGAGAGGESAPPPPIAIRWNAIEQISPIIGKDGKLKESLGLEMPGGAYKKVIERGTKAPVTGHFTIATAVDNQTELTVHVCRGNAERAADNTSLGWYRIESIPQGPAGKELITLVFRVADGAIIGSSIMPKERRCLPLVPSAPPPDR